MNEPKLPFEVVHKLSGHVIARFADHDEALSYQRNRWGFAKTELRELGAPPRTPEVQAKLPFDG